MVLMFEPLLHRFLPFLESLDATFTANLSVREEHVCHVGTRKLGFSYIPHSY